MRQTHQPRFLLIQQFRKIFQFQLECIFTGFPDMDLQVLALGQTDKGTDVGFVVGVGDDEFVGSGLK
jgi:hypothetical protein